MTLPSPQLTARQVVSALLLAFVSGCSSGNTQRRFKLLTGAQSGNLVKLSVALGDADWDGAITYTGVVLNFVLGTAVGLLYLSLQSRLSRAVLALVLAAVFVAVDGFLMGPLEDETTVVRALVCGVVAVPLGALNYVTKRRLHVATSEQTDNVQASVRIARDTVRGMWEDGLTLSMPSHDLLTPAIPIVFVLGGIAGVGLDQTMDYSLGLVAPVFLFGLYASEPEDAAVVAVPPSPPPPLSRRAQRTVSFKL